MPQLSKTNLVLMFTCTWLSLYLIWLAMKKFNLSSNPTNTTTTQKSTPWHWPYT
uniref:ATPase subunit 8 n=1 Tax=Anilios australis TaxID=71009 RepID=A0PDN9_9SAUR|nr:ATPase subunit 8 [Anilios australis]